MKRFLLALAFTSSFVGGATAAEPVSSPIHVTVIGQAANPGPVTLFERHGLMDAIATAGGFTRLAESRKVAVRSPAGQIQAYNFDQILRGQLADVTLHDGDIVAVPEMILPPSQPSVAAPLASPITITFAGEIAHPGPVTLPVAFAPTLINAINAAGGLGRYANTRGIVVKSKTGEQKRINLQELARSPAQDLALHDGDAILIPDAHQPLPEIPVDPAKF